MSEIESEATPGAQATSPEAGPVANGVTGAARETAHPAARESDVRAASRDARDPIASVAPGLAAVLDVPLRVTVEIGSARMLVQEVLQVGPGSVIALDRMAGEPADLLVNGRLVGRGEVIVDEDRLSIRLVEITGGDRLGEDRH